MPFKLPKLDKLLKTKYNFNPLLHNQLVLYLFLFLTLVQIVLFVSKNDITGIVLMCLVGVLTSFFSKNMIVILCVVLISTNLVKQGLKKAGYEGFEEKKDTKDEIEPKKGDDEPKKDDAEPKKDDAEPNKDVAVSKNGKSDEYDIPNSNEKSEKTKDDMKRQIDELSKDYPAFKELQDDLLEGLKKMDPLLDKAEAFMNKYSQYKEDKK
jgi:hypothetical protein